MFKISFNFVKLDFEIAGKSANFDLKNPQNISVDQITFSFYYELIMNFSCNPKDSHNRYELYIALWNRTLVSTRSIRHQLYRANTSDLRNVFQYFSLKTVRLCLKTILKWMAEPSTGLRRGFWIRMAASHGRIKYRRRRS